MYTGNPDVPDDVFADVLEAGHRLRPHPGGPSRAGDHGHRRDPGRPASAGRRDGAVRLRDPRGVGRPGSRPGAGRRDRHGPGVHVAVLPLHVRHQQRHRRPGARRVRHATSRSPGGCRGSPRGTWSPRSRSPSPVPGRTPPACRTTATADGDDWVIDGSKLFITNATEAGLFVVFARIAPHRSPGTASRSSSSRPTAPGIEVGVKDAKMGQEGSRTADVTFSRVRVGPEALVSGDAGGRLQGGDDLPRTRTHPHGRARRRLRPARAGRVGEPRRVGDPGRPADRRLPARAGDDRRPADRGARRPGAGSGGGPAVRQRRGPADRPVGRQALLHRDGRARSPTSPCRSTAAPATCARCPSSGSTATCG